MPMNTEQFPLKTQRNPDEILQSISQSSRKPLNFWKFPNILKLKTIKKKGEEKNPYGKHEEFKDAETLLIDFDGRWHHFSRRWR